MEEYTKKIIIATVIVVAVAFISTSSEQLTGNVPRADKVSFIDAEQDGMIITVKLLPRGNAGRPGKWIDMRVVSGTQHADEKTKCDYAGPKRGSSECKNFEIAEFDVRGQRWTGKRVYFKIRGTNIKSNPIIIK